MYVVAAAPAPVWESSLACVELFTGTGSSDCDLRVLLETHAKAWKKLLGGICAAHPRAAHPVRDAAAAEGERGGVVPGWDPQPGAFDLAVLDQEQQPLLLTELKLDDVDQTLWDIFKLANTLDLPTV